MSSRNNDPVYHYTSVKNARKIAQSRVIKAQDPHGGTTDMPSGVYLTGLPPTTSEEVLCNEVLVKTDDGPCSARMTVKDGKKKFWS